MIKIKKPIKFQWDKGNKDKNWQEHKVTNKECEEVFFDENKKIYKEKLHSKKERLLYTFFTIRNKKIRIISARNINRKEKYLYEKKA